MRLAIVLTCLAATVVLAFGLRLSAPYERDTSLGQERLSATAYHLRRAELALAAHETPVFDRYLGPPVGTAVPWTPLFDGLFAAAVERILPQDPNVAETGGVHEADLEWLAARLGPFLGCLTLLGIFVAAWALGGSPVWALGAALLYAVSPTAIRVEGAAYLDARALDHTLLAWSVALGLQALAARDGPDVLQGGLLAGLCVGLALLAGVAGGFAALLTGCAFLGIARTSDEVGLAARRAGLFLCLVAAFIAAFVAQTTERAVAGNVAFAPGAAASWLHAASIGMFAMSLPFALSFTAKSAGGRRWIAVAAVLIASVALLPRFVEHLRSSVVPIWEMREYMEEWRRNTDLATTALALVALLACLALWRSVARARWLIAALALSLCGLFLLQTAASATVGACIAIGCALGSATNQTWRTLAATGLVLTLSASALALVQRAPAQTGFKWTPGFEQLRTLLPAQSPWNVATARPGPSVLTHWPRGLELAYRARRPPTTTIFEARTNPARFERAARVLFEEDPARWVPELRELGVGYVLGGNPFVGQDFGPLLKAATPEDCISRGSLLQRVSSGGPVEGLTRIESDELTAAGLVLYAVDQPASLRPTVAPR